MDTEDAPSASTAQERSEENAQESNPRRETGSTSDTIVTERRRSEDHAEELHQRSSRLNHSLRTRSAINSGLGLCNNNEYGKLYAFVHKWLEDRNKISQTHRSMGGQRTRIQNEVSTHPLQNQDVRK
jgi:hypothetical protein